MGSRLSCTRRTRLAPGLHEHGGGRAITEQPTCRTVPIPTWNHYRAIRDDSLLRLKGVPLCRHQGMQCQCQHSSTVPTVPLSNSSAALPVAHSQRLPSCTGESTRRLCRMASRARLGRPAQGRHNWPVQNCSRSTINTEIKTHRKIIRPKNSSAAVPGKGKSR